MHSRIYFALVFSAVVALLLVLIPGGTSQAQTEIVVTVILVWPTATDTPEPTEGPSPTPTATLTPTPDYVSEATVEVDGVFQDVAFVYAVDAGQVAIIVWLTVITVLALVGLLVFVRKP